jgi:hypothetical protein
MLRFRPPLLLHAGGMYRTFLFNRPLFHPTRDNPEDAVSMFFPPQVHLGDKPLETHDTNFIIQLNTCGLSPCVIFSLTRGWVCHLQLLLVLASAVNLRPESRETRDHMLLSQIRDSCESQEATKPEVETGTVKYVRESHGSRTRK